VVGVAYYLPCRAQPRTTAFADARPFLVSRSGDIFVYAWCCYSDGTTRCQRGIRTRLRRAVVYATEPFCTAAFAAVFCPAPGSTCYKHAAPHPTYLPFTTHFTPYFPGYRCYCYARLTTPHYSLLHSRTIH